MELEEIMNLFGPLFKPTRVCAWCNRVLTRRIWVLGGRRVSHGICSDCGESFFATYEPETNDDGQPWSAIDAMEAAA
jgi:hypothetical protein